MQRISIKGNTCTSPTPSFLSPKYSRIESRNEQGCNSVSGFSSRKGIQTPRIAVRPKTVKFSKSLNPLAMSRERVKLKIEEIEISAW